VSRRRFALVGLGLGVAASQGGHLLAFELRYGSAAAQVQSAGAHAYFPALVKTGLGAAAAVTLVALLVIGFARVTAGRSIRHEPAPSLLRLFAFLYTIQLACFVLQEGAESALAAASPASPVVLLLWGTAGQLPVALVAALALRWLLIRLGPALEQLHLIFAPARQRFVYAVKAPELSLAPHVALSGGHVACGFNRRGPPF